MKRIIGITGGIASGKSNVCSVITSMGYPVINCDEISKGLSEKGQPIYNAIVQRFGSDYLLDDGQLNKKMLAKLIFNNSAAKLLLNSITHPVIIEEVKSRIKDIVSDLIFVEAPLLYEAKMEEMFDKIICVFLSKKFQVERLMERDKIDEDYALAKIHSQMDLYMKKTLADYVVDSKGSFDETKLQVEEIINDIKGV